MDTSILEGLGLSKGEIGVYITLLEIGTTKVGKIIEKSGMASSAVHNSINSLVEKGLVSYIKKGKIKSYQATPAKNILDFIDEKKKKFLEVLPELEAKQKFAKEKQEAEIFKGIKGILSMLNIQIEDTNNGDEYRFFATQLEGKNEEIQKFFRRYDAKRAEKGLIIKGLAPSNLKSLFQGRKVLKMKYTDNPIPSDISICKDKVALISWGENPVGYLIISKQIFEKFKRFFDETWKNA
ncbi:MAG TPA: helix-turn-helix domain-containing protein [Candidatus Nanoarchaeia archaeon]|nr:helix-turn-helix domain-containing protein [Candidatus Nanoarchaeia archaeon]